MKLTGLVQLTGEIVGDRADKIQCVMHVCVCLKMFLKLHTSLFSTQMTSNILAQAPEHF